MILMSIMSVGYQKYDMNKELKLFSEADTFLDCFLYFIHISFAHVV